jgi:hypothetical protein
MTRQRPPNAVDRVMAEYVCWGGPVVTRAVAYRSAIRAGFAGLDAANHVFIRPTVPAPDDPDAERAFLARIDGVSVEDL